LTTEKINCVDFLYNVYRLSVQVVSGVARISCVKIWSSNSELTKSYTVLQMTFNRFYASSCAIALALYIKTRTESAQFLILVKATSSKTDQKYEKMTSSDVIVTSSLRLNISMIIIKKQTPLMSNDGIFDQK